MANATESGWTELQQMEDQVLAVSALFGMFQVNIAAVKHYCQVFSGSVCPEMLSNGDSEREALIDPLGTVSVIRHLCDLQLLWQLLFQVPCCVYLYAD